MSVVPFALLVVFVLAVLAVAAWAYYAPLTRRGTRDGGAQ